MSLETAENTIEIKRELDKIALNLLSRYSGNKAKGIADVIKDNKDLPISKMNEWTKQVYNKNAAQFLTSIGVIKRGGCGARTMPVSPAEKSIEEPAEIKQENSPGLESMPENLEAAVETEEPEVTRAEIDFKRRKDDFFAWLATKVPMNKATDMYLMYAEMDEYYKNSPWHKKSMFEVYDEEELRTTKRHINTKDIFKTAGKRKEADKAIRLFDEYLVECNNKFIS